MSLYNAINGRHPRSKEILALLGLTEDMIERYRDCRIFPKTRTIQIRDPDRRAAAPDRNRPRDLSV